MTDRRDRFVMIVEDEALQALDLTSTVEKAGFDTLGPFADASSAVEALEDFVPDAALLDIRLDQDTSQKVADALCDLDVPFAFITAHAKDRSTLIEGHEKRPVFSKPVAPAAVVALADKLSAESPDAA